MHLLYTRLVLATFTLLIAFATACGEDKPTSLTVVTHESFDVTKALIEKFENKHNVTVTFIAAGDANEVVNRAILNAGNPEGDVLFGIDNLNFHGAVETGVFSEFRAKRRNEIAPDILNQFENSLFLTPIDFGYVNLNFDAAAGEPPQTLEELIEPQWRGKLVVEDPGRSSPGLQFLATTVAYFGEGAWQEYWRALRKNDVAIASGWSEAYYSHFSLYDGDRPIVVSYTTSPAAEVFFAEGAITEPPTLNIIPAPLFRQVEAAGILAGSKNKDLAGKFIDFMLSDGFQRQIPETMFVYPAIDGTETPEFWRWAQVSIEPAQLESSADEITRWIREWTEIMLR